ncbi:hypothetical protein [Legionella fallonii]|uniref:Transmembrane protein n=1 Tax=Legionella fallonii LLAP-10 TaxID=1212491 RepID=A0A098G268_9GAMM|nr:hypothetical protein [Legionella fallonii]CEG55590.1 conserved membrane protein of unknown function [Legionella fallonii LLAP-10]
MSLKSDDNQALTQTELVFILAIAGRIDAQCRIVAQHLDKDRSVYYAYAVLDSLSSSYSMFKYFFDVFIPNSNSDTMHDFMMTPGGMIAAAAETLFLVGFSVLAVKFDGEKEDNYKKRIADAWPYFRDIIKGLKNAYKGWRSAVVALHLLGIADVNFLIAPVGFVLGILAAANRYWLRSMIEERKVMMTANAELRSEIKKLFTMTEEESKYYLGQIKYQTDTTRILSYLSVGIGGFIDGLYLYVGVIGLAVLSSPMLSVLAAMSVFYTVACIVTRIYEEYDFQVRLFVTQTKCKLEILAKQIETTYAKLLSLQEQENKNLDDVYEIKLLKAKIFNLLGQFDANREILSQQSNRTYLSAALLGLKNGLYAYGALASGLFLFSTLLALCGVAFPPALLMATAILGILLIGYFVIHSLVMNYCHLEKENINEARPYNQLVDLKNKMSLSLDVDELLEKDSFHESLNDGLAVDSSPQFFIQEWCEVLRSLFSGFGKGQKFVDFAGNCLQEADEAGHYHDTPLMYVLSLFSALFFGGVLAFRALARGLGRAAPGQEPSATKEELKKADTSNLNAEKDTLSGANTLAVSPNPLEKDAKPAPVNLEDTDKAEFQTRAEGESISAEKTATDSRSTSNTFSNRSLVGFFETKNNTIKKRPLHHSASDVDLSSRVISDNTILGLG